MSMVDWFFTYMLGVMVSTLAVAILDSSREEGDQLTGTGAAASVLAWPIGVPVVALTVLAYHLRPHFGEEARLRREIRRVEHERKLLKLRAALEKEQAAYRREFDRYVDDA